MLRTCDRPTFELYRVSTEQYGRMLGAGIFREGDRVALVDGVVVSEDGGEADDATVYRVSVEQYHAMIDAGILTPDDRVELLDGFLARKMGKNPPHSASLRRCRRRLEAMLPPGWMLDIQDPITMLESEPEPDLSIIRGEMEDYDNRHPGPADIALVVVISDTTLRGDLGVKAALYAEALIPLYWLLNIPKRRLEVRSEPSGPGAAPAYGRVELLEVGDSAALVLDGVEVGRVEVRELLP